jgi:hypothetical protein
MTPPRPNPATVPRAIVVISLSGVTTESAPPKQVRIALAQSKIQRLPPGKVLRRALKKMAPIVVLRPGARPLRPTRTGFGLYTEEMRSGQKLRSEKKFMPATNATE